MLAVDDLAGDGRTRRRDADSADPGRRRRPEAPSRGAAHGDGDVAEARRHGDLRAALAGRRVDRLEARVRPSRARRRVRRWGADRRRAVVRRPSGSPDERAPSSASPSIVIGVASASPWPARRSSAAVGSMITGLQTMPSIAWFPLAIVLFQLTEGAIRFVVVLGAAPSIANGLIAGIDHVPPLLLRAGRVIGARGWAAPTATSSCRPRCRRSSAASSRAGRSPGAA